METGEEGTDNDSDDSEVDVAGGYENVEISQDNFIVEEVKEDEQIAITDEPWSSWNAGDLDQAELSYETTETTTANEVTSVEQQQHQENSDNNDSDENKSVELWSSRNLSNEASARVYNEFIVKVHHEEYVSEKEEGDFIDVPLFQPQILPHELSLKLLSSSVLNIRRVNRVEQQNGNVLIESNQNIENVQNMSMVDMVFVGLAQIKTSTGIL